MSSKKAASREPRFLTDSMHGKLSHWLRMLGYNTIYYPREDDEILRAALEENRIVLTSDVELHKRILSRGGDSILLPLNDTPSQLSNIALRLQTSHDIPPEEFLSVKFRLCSLCNGELRHLASDRWRCSVCGQEYWVGSHWRNISRILAKAREMILKPGKE